VTTTVYICGPPLHHIALVDLSIQGAAVLREGQEVVEPILAQYRVPVGDGLVILVTEAGLYRTPADGRADELPRHPCGARSTDPSARRGHKKAVAQSRICTTAGCQPGIPCMGWLTRAVPRVYHNSPAPRNAWNPNTIRRSTAHPPDLGGHQQREAT